MSILSTLASALVGPRLPTNMAARKMQNEQRRTEIEAARAERAERINAELARSEREAHAELEKLEQEASAFELELSTAIARDVRSELVPLLARALDDGEIVEGRFVGPNAVLRMVADVIGKFDARVQEELGGTLEPNTVWSAVARTVVVTRPGALAALCAGHLATFAGGLTSIDYAGAFLRAARDRDVPAMRSSLAVLSNALEKQAGRSDAEPTDEHRARFEALDCGVRRRDLSDALDRLRSLEAQSAARDSSPSPPISEDESEDGDSPRRRLVMRGNKMVAASSEDDEREG